MMKELGAPIEYDRYKESYYYSEKGGFNIRFSKNLLAVSTVFLLFLMNVWY
ncbi:hypothetical protein [Chitinophaga vietnamensis]|uniref:hypothetical protein n=1 Tax=Chitinophaga vietnamensis TaxID=2593957 RepID=UPI001F44C3B2